NVQYLVQKSGQRLTVDAHTLTRNARFLPHAYAPNTEKDQRERKKNNNKE
ncbi:uncharacterized protein SETTUDRAFT_163365, partial [Exserohilum turcica Et28A]